METRKHTQTHTNTQMQTHRQTHKFTLTNTHTNTYTHTLTHTHTHMFIHIYTYTHCYRRSKSECARTSTAKLCKFFSPLHFGFYNAKFCTFFCCTLPPNFAFFFSVHVRARDWC